MILAEGGCQVVVIATLKKTKELRERNLIAQYGTEGQMYLDGSEG